MRRFALYRALSLIAPPALAWTVALSASQRTGLTHAVVYALGPLWLLGCAGTFARVIERAVRDRRGPILGPHPLSSLDVLTPAGAAFAWSCAFAIMGSTWLGWASLGAVGLLGSVLLQLVVLNALIAVRGNDPIRRASIKRRFIPETAREGERVVEEMHFERPRIPMGFRLFATGRIGPRWAMSRYALDAGESGADIKMESDLGAAVRGEHDAAPLEMWLEDIFGLCHSEITHAGGARLVVLPKPHPLDSAKPLLERGFGARKPKNTRAIASEGNFHLREYQHGDDVRRIHWMRSQSAQQIVVRMPDEIPPDQPQVRLVLDTYFTIGNDLGCDAPGQLLDAVISVWLAMARKLSESGVRVTLVTAAPEGKLIEKSVLHVRRGSFDAALRLGARVRWQENLSLLHLLTDEATIVVSARPPPPREVDAAAKLAAKAARQSEPLWVCVPPGYAVSPPQATSSNPLRFPFAMGAPDNDAEPRRLAEQSAWRARGDFRVFLAVTESFGRVPVGCLVAVGRQGKICVEEAR